jgi:DNA-binding HxlR family transcriptional regulator
MGVTGGAEQGSTKQCALAPSLIRGVHLLQEKWLLLIVHRLLEGPVGFNELSRQADGVNATTLSQRLSQLEEAGLAVKTVHSTMPPRTSYELTAAGRDLKPVLDAIEAWSARYLANDPDGLPPCGE